jgi:hypothetical protein
MNDIHGGYVSRNSIYKAARRLKERHGAGLSLDTFCRETGFPRQIVLHLFGNWDKVRRMIGLAPLADSTRRRLTDQEIRDLLIQHEQQREGKLAKWEFCRLIGISNGELNHRFGTWLDLRESVGLPHRRVERCVYTEQDIEQDMLQVYLRIGFCPGFHQWKLWGGKISASTLRSRYRTWYGVKIRFEIMRREHHLRLDPNWTPEQHAAELKRRRAQAAE